MHVSPLVWLPRTIAEEMEADANEWHDLETGGTFAGYWANEAELVITAHVRAGPKASRQRSAYEPDLHWQQERLDETYQASGRLDVYLGDWHSHPGAKAAYLSSRDRACLKGIISSPTARQPRPLTMLMLGEPGDRMLYATIGTMRKAFGLLPLLDTTAATIRLH